MRSFHRLGVGLTAVTLIVGVAACGSDDDEASGGDEASSFCDDVVAFNTAAFDTDVPEDASSEDVIAAGERLSPLSQALVDGAPEGLTDGAEAIHSFVAPMVEGDAEKFNDDSSFETYTSFVNDAIGACNFAAEAVTGSDYAFDAADTIEAGTVAFSFTNASEGEEHEMVVLQKLAGVDLSWDELLALPEEEGRSKTKFVTVAFAPPGGDSATLATLDAGSYAMVCFVPVGGADDGPPHFTQGMVHEFSVA